MCIVIIANVTAEQMYSYRLYYIHMQTHIEYICIYKISKITIYGLYFKQIYQLSLNTIKVFKHSSGISSDGI